ncbi:MAG: cupredoxin domain-containing protein [Chloroflexi bacterium]|nr:cupredoxin domain-containing protein [Chloroflexota bacterium]
MLFRAVVLIAIAIVMISVACGDADPEATPQPTEAPTQTVSPANGSGDVVRVENWDIGGSGEYIFVPSEFQFSVGETVTFEMSAETEVHTFTVEELGIDEIIGPGQTITFTHTFDRAGEFEVTCTPHLAFGMTGTIIVS